VARLKDLFPDRPDTLIMEGYQQVLVGEYDLAVSSLRTALAKETSPRAYRILARAEQQRGNLEAALEAISRATTHESDAEPDSLRLRALIEFQSGLYMDAAANLLELYRLTGLESADQLLLARCYYENKTPGVGRKLLLSLLGRDGVGTKASLEFAKRDASNPRQRPVIRKHLLKAHEKFPNNLEVLETITKFDLEEGGLHDEIIERLNAGVDRRSWLARPYLIRGRAMLALDHPLSARDDAERALRLDPATTEEAYEILFAAYLAIGNLPEFIQSMEARKARSGLNENRTALLARLHLSLDNAARASELYEEAITRGSGLVFVKNDLAFLLAQSGRDLDRALSLARAATDAPGEHLTTADTLGYVYLKRGQADAAIWQFRHVINEADPPVADYHYHLGLALLALKREAEALESFDRALAINPGFAEAAAARRDLVGEGQRIGSPEDNSS
jgi:tetratricopeptide (TPR) repeat protein